MEGNYYMKNKNTNSSSSITHNNGFEEHSWGTSSSTWPARSYGCSFCKREFKSAQALGGHMNVHRRDRARLRSSWLSDHTPKPNPNPNNNNHTNPTTTLFSSSSSPLSNDPFSNCSSHISPIYNNPNYYLNLSSSPSPNLASITRSEDKKPRLIISTPQALPLVKNPQNMEEINMVMMMSKKNKSGDFVGEVVEEERKNHVFKNKRKEHNNNITLELGIGLVNHKEQQKLDLELRL